MDLIKLLAFQPILCVNNAESSRIRTENVAGGLPVDQMVCSSPRRSISKWHKVQLQSVIDISLHDI